MRRLLQLWLHAVVNAHWCTQRFLTALLKAKHSPPEKTVLVTGTFFSKNWIMNHLKPLAMSKAVEKLLVVTTFPIHPIPKIHVLYPPERLVRTMGSVPARLLYFTMCAFRYRPDVIGGFHLLLNGLLASFLAKLIRAKSLYFCGGGPREVLDGGIHGSRLFSLMGRKDAILERKLIRALNAFDIVITMGPQAINFFKKRGVNARFEVIPGGIDEMKVPKVEWQKKEYDCILVGRLESVKRVDLFLEVVSLLKAKRKLNSAVIVGDGTLKKRFAENGSRVRHGGECYFYRIPAESR